MSHMSYLSLCLPYFGFCIELLWKCISIVVITKHALSNFGSFEIVLAWKIYPNKLMSPNTSQPLLSEMSCPIPYLAILLCSNSEDYLQFSYL